MMIQIKIAQARKGEVMQIYTVKTGDSIYSIARKFGTTPSRIVTDNELADPARLAVGQTLVILEPTRTYTVRGGDTLEGIARLFGVSLTDLWRNNPILGGKTYIYPGQTLNISFAPPPLGDISVNGYVYPFVDRDVLRKTLPYLTYLSIFSYGIREDGTLVPPALGDDEIISIAREYGSVPLMMLTSLTDRGTFSSELATRTIQNEAVSQTLAENAVRTMVEKGYGGIDVDFEYIEPSAREGYVRFINQIRDALPEGGDYEIFVSLAPKNSDDMRGLLYEGIDYTGLGEAADRVLAMTYEWGYTYGPPMAVSPIQNVERVLDYAVSRIPADKVMMGIPNYAYDWPLPYVKGETKADSMSNVMAVKLAIDKNAAIQYDETAQTPYFKYFDRTANGPIEHEVWFDDARSMDAKLRLMNDKDLYGGSVWNVMNYFPQLWTVMNQLYSIRKK